MMLPVCLVEGIWLKSNTKLVTSTSPQSASYTNYLTNILNLLSLRLHIFVAYIQIGLTDTYRRLIISSETIGMTRKLYKFLYNTMSALSSDFFLSHIKYIYLNSTCLEWKETRIDLLH